MTLRKTVRTYSQQKSALTRAERTERTPQATYDAVLAECERTLAEWASPEWRAVHRTNAWPDDWSRWDRALCDAASAVARETGAWPKITDLDEISV